MIFASRDEIQRVLIERRRMHKKNLEKISKDTWEQYHEILKQQNQKS